MWQSKKYEYVDCLPVDEIHWKATGNYPTIKISESDLSPGWVNLKFEYQVEEENQRNPVISFEISGIKRRIRLNRKQNNCISHVFKIPEGVSEVSIELLGAKESFLLGEPQFEGISRFSAMKSILIGVWNQKNSKSRHLIKNGISLISQYIKNYGLKAFAHRLVEVYREGIGREALIGKSSSVYEEFQQDWALTGEDDLKIEAAIEKLSNLPLISVIMPVFDPEEEHLKMAIDSVIEQRYPNWELCIADDASTQEQIREIIDQRGILDSRIKVVKRPENGHISAASNSALSLAEGEWVAFLDHDDILHPAALFCVAHCLQDNPNLRFIYTDEDKIDSHGKRYDPYFKPDYNPTLLTSQNYFNHLSVIKRTLVKEVGSFRLGYEGAQDYDLFLRCVEKIQSDQIFHIPFPLYSWRASSGSTATDVEAKGYAEEAGVKALKDHFQQLGETVSVSGGSQPTTYRVERVIPDSPPQVSIVIPTRDGGSYLRKCLSSLHGLTSYPNFEVVILNNGSIDNMTLEILSDYQTNGLITVFDNSDPFNYSALNNFGVEKCNGDLICLLNDDIEIISTWWLNELVAQLLSPGVGVVGAKLLYPDQSIQHAGIVTGIGGIAGHSHKHATSKEDGYFSRLRVVHDVGAVTGACLLTTRELWSELGGLDEEFLKVAFNDVDFCLRARTSGFRVVWTPYAELIHHESKTRGLDITKSKMERLQNESDTMKKRWGEFLLKDPAYNPNLSLATENFEISDRPRSLPYWRFNK